MLGLSFGWAPSMTSVCLPIKETCFYKNENPDAIRYYHPLKISRCCTDSAASIIYQIERCKFFNIPLAICSSYNWTYVLDKYHPMNVLQPKGKKIRQYPILSLKVGCMSIQVLMPFFNQLRPYTSQSNVPYFIKHSSYFMHQFDPHFGP